MSSTILKNTRRRLALFATAGAALLGVSALSAGAAVAGAPHYQPPVSGGHGHGLPGRPDHGHAPFPGHPHFPAKPPVEVQLKSPVEGQVTGIGSKGWFVDLAARFPTNLAATGFSGEQLTGPGAHNNAAPFPGSFSPGQDDRFPGLIVLVSTTQATNPDGTSTGLAGPGQNLANLFNLTGVTDRGHGETEISDTWIVGAPLFGHNTPATVYVAVAADKNHDGIYNDAPATISDINHDGKVDQRDLEAFGIASNVASARFVISD